MSSLYHAREVDWNIFSFWGTLVQCCRYILCWWMDMEHSGKRSQSVCGSEPVCIDLFIAVVKCTADYILPYIIPSGYFVYNGSQFVFCSTKITTYSESREKKVPWRIIWGSVNSQRPCKHLLAPNEEYLCRRCYLIYIHIIGSCGAI